jgi:hypothetical protein
MRHPRELLTVCLAATFAMTVATPASAADTTTPPSVPVACTTNFDASSVVTFLESCNAAFASATGATTNPAASLPDQPITTGMAAGLDLSVVNGAVEDTHYYSASPGVNGSPVATASTSATSADTSLGLSAGTTTVSQGGGYDSGGCSNNATCSNLRLYWHSSGYWHPFGGEALWSALTPTSPPNDGYYYTFANTEDNVYSAGASAPSLVLNSTYMEGDNSAASSVLDFAPRGTIQGQSSGTYSAGVSATFGSKTGNVTASLGQTTNLYYDTMDGRINQDQAYSYLTVNSSFCNHSRENDSSAAFQTPNSFQENIHYVDEANYYKSKC